MHVADAADTLANESVPQANQEKGGCEMMHLAFEGEDGDVMEKTIDDADMLADDATTEGEDDNVVEKTIDDAGMLAADAPAPVDVEETQGADMLAYEAAPEEVQGMHEANEADTLANEFVPQANQEKGDCEMMPLAFKGEDDNVVEKIITDTDMLADDTASEGEDDNVV